MAKLARFLTECKPMSMRWTVTLGLVVWVSAISLLHGGLNLGLFDRATLVVVAAGTIAVNSGLAPNDPAGLDSMVMTVVYGEGAPAFSPAIDLLVQSHAATRKARLSVSTLARKPSTAVKKLIRAVIDKNPDPYIKGLACLALGQCLKQQADRIRDHLETARTWEVTSAFGRRFT